MRRAVAVSVTAAALIAVAVLAIHGYLATVVRDRLDADLAAAIPGTHLAHDGIEVGAFAASATMTAPRIHRNNRGQPVMQAATLTLTRQSSLWVWFTRGRLAVTVALDSIKGRTAEGIPFRAQALDLSKVVLERIGGRLVPVTGVARLRRGRSGLDGWPAPMAEALRRAGYTEVRFGGRAEYRYDPIGQRLVVPRARLGLDGMGELTAELTLTGLAPGAIAGEPAAALVSAALGNARLTYRDDGLVPRLLASEAQAAGLPPSRYRHRLAEAASFWLNGHLGDAAAPIGRALGSFLREPGALHARLRPETPVPARTIALAAAFGRWGALAGQLGLRVEAEAGSQAVRRDGDAPRPPTGDSTARR